MKKILLLIVFVFAILDVFSQDILILKNGDEIKSKILEITTDQIKYKKWDNLEGPSYASLKSEVFMIKYENGTKDVFKTQETNNINVVSVNNEDKEKEEAVKNLENYLRNKNIGKVIEILAFRKTNGEMLDIYGQKMYTIKFEIDIKFNSDGWLKGNGMEGYWRNSLYVYSSEPDLAASGETYTYVTKFYRSGTLLTLRCVAQMKSTDNGFMVNELNIKAETNYGVVASNLNSSSNLNQTQTSKLSASYVGEYKNGKKEGQGKQIYQNGTIYEGQWKDDKRNGYGTFTNEYGDVYIGYFKNDQRDSIGKITSFIEPKYSDSTKSITTEGIFKNDKIYNGVMTHIDWKGRKKQLLFKDGIKSGDWKKVKE